jgi:RNA polymerase sigma-70 factor (ECF subfamily)
VSREAREEQWAAWLREAIAGDAAVYHTFLSAVAPHVRAMALRRCDQLGAARSEAEDVTQEVLLAIHLKRGTWDPKRPLGPWLSTLVRNKMIDSLRRRGRRVVVPIEDVIDTLEVEEAGEVTDKLDVERALRLLKDPQLSIVRSISLEGAGVRETAERLGMSEGAVRVALHRALKALAAFHRGATP